MANWMEGDWPDGCEIESDEVKDAKHLILLLRALLDKLPSSELDELVGEVEVSLENFASHFENSDPRSMGWVGDDGLP